MRLFGFKKEIFSLLRQNISVGQLTGYFIANLVGLTVILVGVLFYCDSQKDNSERDRFFSNNYIVISKIVEGIGFSPVTFSEDEITELKEQPWVKKIGRFTASNFAVNGSVALKGLDMSSYLFFESVPDEFFDIKPEGWSFKPENGGMVPVVLFKDYLTLYNFGFAMPQGLPQLSEEVISEIPIILRMTGEGNQQVIMDARIVGLSSRLNTIAVPQSFMDWANSYLSPESPKQESSRLIIEIDPLRTASMNKYFEERDIEVAGEKKDAGNISHFLGVVSTVAAVNGFVICILAMFILVLSIFLLLQKSREKLWNLMLLGYNPRNLGRYYEFLVVAINFLITALALLFTFMARPLWEKELLEIGLGEASALPTLLFALGYLLIVTMFDIFIIRRHIMKIWRSK